MGGFAWEAIEQESARQGCTVEELLAFAMMYYLADADSGRIAREISRSPYHATPRPGARLAGGSLDADSTDASS